MENYFVITCSEDGIHIEQVDKEELLKRITTDESGYHCWGNRELKFLDYIPTIDKGYFYEEGSEDMIIIIKGDFVIPEAKEVVTSWEI